MNLHPISRGSTAAAKIKRSLLLLLFIAGTGTISSGMDAVTSTSLLPHRTRLSETNPHEAVPDLIAKVRVGMKRKDAVKTLSQKPGPIVSVAETYSSRVFASG